VQAIKDVRKKNQLSEEDLKTVTGGAKVDNFLKIDGIDGEARTRSTRKRLTRLAGGDAFVRRCLGLAMSPRHLACKCS